MLTKKEAIIQSTSAVAEGNCHKKKCSTEEHFYLNLFYLFVTKINFWASTIYLRIWCITFVHTYKYITNIYILAFMCHHNTFLLYCSIEDTSLGKWNKVTHASIFISFVMMVLMAFGGYATFTQNVQGNMYTFCNCALSTFPPFFRAFVRIKMILRMEMVL